MAGTQENSRHCYELCPSNLTMRMRSITSTLLISLAVSALGCSAASSADDDDDDVIGSSTASAFTQGTALVTTTDLNLRSGPGTSASVLTVLRVGTKVTVTSTPAQGSWRHVTATAGTGWVHEVGLARPLADGEAGGGGAVSARGQEQMSRLVSYADRNHSGASRGRCFEYVWRYLSSSGYGNIDSYGDAADMPSAYARNFAEYMNQPANAARWGLQRLPLSNPYDAPRGAVVVVAAGSPGTAHPTAGDISVAAGNGRFINDGPSMGYGGSRAAFTSGGGRVLGIFVPR